MIAVTFALPAESSDFVRAIGRDVRVLHTGVGENIARTRLQEFLAQLPRPHLLITAGFAGALTDELQIGDLFLAENFSDATALTNARHTLAGLSVHVGKLETTDVILDSPNERRSLGRRTGASAVDMETAAIVEACRALDLPTLSLRTITDTPTVPFPAPPGVLFDLAKQKTNVARLAGYLALHPPAIGRLIAFAGRVSRARAALTSALELLVRPTAV